MRHTFQNSDYNLSYIAVLLLLAYFLSSAPRYVRQVKENFHGQKTEKVSPVRGVLKLGKYYGVDPYKRAWNRLVPGSDKTEPATNPSNFAVLTTHPSR